MNIKKVGNKYLAYAPGNLRIPGEYLLRQQAEAAYSAWVKVDPLPEVIPMLSVGSPQVIQTPKGTKAK